MDAEPVVLHGGHMSRVVRIGGSVHRTAGPWTPTVQRLLRHLRARGLSWLPEPRGFDAEGREVLAFLPGHVPHEMPDWIWSEPVLHDVARALRQWHDASADFDQRESVWGLPPREPREVVCHHDIAPYNCVFREQRLAGVIDFDLCAPGPRLWDLVYTAYRFVPLMPPREAELDDGAQERSPFTIEETVARLASFLASYGAGPPALVFAADAVIDTARARLQAIADFTSELARAGNSALKDHARMYRAHAEWLHGELGGRLGLALAPREGEP